MQRLHEVTGVSQTLSVHYQSPHALAFLSPLSIQYYLRYSAHATNVTGGIIHNGTGEKTTIGIIDLHATQAGDWSIGQGSGHTFCWT